jgi:hypothetical protein
MDRYSLVVELEAIDKKGTSGGAWKGERHMKWKFEYPKVSPWLLT